MWMKCTWLRVGSTVKSRASTAMKSATRVWLSSFARRATPQRRRNLRRSARVIISRSSFQRIAMHAVLRSSCRRRWRSWRHIFSSETSTKTGLWMTFWPSLVSTWPGSPTYSARNALSTPFSSATQIRLPGCSRMVESLSGSFVNLLRRC